MLTDHIRQYTHKSMFCLVPLTRVLGARAKRHFWAKTLYRIAVCAEHFIPVAVA